MEVHSERNVSAATPNAAEARVDSLPRFRDKVPPRACFLTLPKSHCEHQIAVSMNRPDVFDADGEFWAPNLSPDFDCVLSSHIIAQGWFIVVTRLL